MTWLVTIHGLGGSTAEAVEPVWAFTLADKAFAMSAAAGIQQAIDPNETDWWVRTEEVHDLLAHDLPLTLPGDIDFAALAAQITEYDQPLLKTTVPPASPAPAPLTPLEEPMTTTSDQEKENAELEVMLRFNVDADGQPLTPESRAAMEARLGKPVQAEIKNVPEPEPVADAARPPASFFESVNTYEGMVALLTEILATVDPADSDTHLAVFKWLQERDRVQRLGTLNIPGTGYLYQYSEPKGSTKAGYVLGGTQGDRMVDNALEAVTATGAQPTKHGVCQFCGKIVTQEGEGPITTSAGETVCVQSGTRVHVLA